MPDATATGSLIAGQIQQAERDGDAEVYTRLAGALREADGQLREQIQALARDRVKALVLVLRGREPLSSADLALAKALIVGDADHYTQMENNVMEWRDELKRLAGELQRSGIPSDVAEALHVRALVMDALQVTNNLSHYYEQKGRVEAFTESTQKLSPEERRTLWEILDRKLQSKDW